MNFSQSINAFIQKRFDFYSRSRRSEFWWLQLAYILLVIFVAVIESAIFDISETARFTPLTTLLDVILIIPMAALTARRLHDVGLTGWAQIPMYLMYISYLPGYENFLSAEMGYGTLELTLMTVFLVYCVWMLVNLVRDSQSGTNKYGPNPKAIALDNVFD